MGAYQGSAFDLICDCSQPSPFYDASTKSAKTSSALDFHPTRRPSSTFFLFPVNCGFQTSSAERQKYQIKCMEQIKTFLLIFHKSGNDVCSNDCHLVFGFWISLDYPTDPWKPQHSTDQEMRFQHQRHKHPSDHHRRKHDHPDTKNADTLRCVH